MDNKIFFTVEYPGAETKKSDFLNLIPKDKICLYFLRYGYFDISEPRDCMEITDYPTAPKVDKSIFEGDEKKYIPLAENQLRIVTPKGVPLLENFSLQRTFLNKGYIYLINDNPNAEDAFTEVTIDECGFLEYVVKKGSLDKDYKDLRHPITSHSHRHFLLVDKGSKYWIAYSPIQWSWAYLKEMLNNEKKRKERMLWVECKGIYKNEKLPMHLSSFKDVSIHFHKDNGQEHYFSKKLKLICSDERRQDEAGDNYIFEDMFITLHDSIGCARDISEGVCKKMLEFNACIQALQSGETFEAAFKRLSNGIFDIPEATTEKEIEYRQLFSLALTCYQLVYNDKSSIYKYDGGSPGMNFFDLHYFQEIVYSYNELEGAKIPLTEVIGNGLSGQKLEGILGIKEREELRETLLSYRNDFGKFLTEEKFLKVYLKDILENHWSHILIGQDNMTDILHCLSFNPYDMERPLLLKKEYVEKEQWTEWFYNLLNKNKGTGEEDTLKTLLNKTIEIEDSLYGTKEAIATSKVLKKYFTYYEKSFSKTYTLDKNKVYVSEKMNYIVKKLNTQYKAYGYEMLRIEDDQIQLYFKEMGVELNPNDVKTGPYRGKEKEKVMHLLKESTPNGVSYVERKPGQVHYSNVEMTFSVRRDVSQNVNPRAAKARLFIAKLVNSKEFNSLFFTIETFNFIFAMKQVSKDPNEKTYVNIVAAGAKLADAGMTLAKATLSEKAVRTTTFIGFSATFTALSGTFAFYFSSYDAINLNKKGDYDAAIAMGLSGIAFGISTVSAVGSILGIGALAMGPVGWIAALAALGLAFIASALSDTEIETYFKNFILSDRVDYPKLPDQSPMDYTRSFLNEKTKEKMVPDIDNYREIMMHPSDAQATLFDMIVCGEIKFVPIDPVTKTINLEIRSNLGVFTQTTQQQSATHFRADIVLNRFLSNPNFIDIEAILYPNGLESPELSFEADVEPASKDEWSNVLSITFGVPKIAIKHINGKSEILFALRLRIDPKSNFYFPYPLKNKTVRYLGARINLKSKGVFFANQLTQQKKIKIESLENLKNPDIWK